MTDNKEYCAICAFTGDLTKYYDIYLCRRCDDKYTDNSSEEGAEEWMIY